MSFSNKIVSLICMALRIAKDNRCSLGDILDSNRSELSIRTIRAIDQTYNLVTKAHSNAELAHHFTHALNKEVKYVQVPYEAAKKSFMDSGFPEWQVDGIMELFKMFDADSKVTNMESGDFKKITGRNPTSIQDWVAQVAPAFGIVKKISILGTGDVGKALAAGLIKHGYDVMIGSRDGKSERCGKLADEIKGLKTGTFTEALAHAHTTILAIGFSNVQECIKAAGADHFKGKLVIDATNPIKGMGPAGIEFSCGFDTSAGEKIQAWLPHSAVVKCWNVIGHLFMIDPPADPHGRKPDMWIAGNDDGAVAAVRSLLGVLGWARENVIVGNGGIIASRWIEPFCQAWVNYGLLYGTWKHAFALLKFQ
jgi:predicted dinucleotide-binding enzyme